MKTFIPVCPTSEIPEGARAVFSIKNHWVAIFQVSGRYYAIEDMCTHDGNVLTEDLKGNEVPLKGYEITCSRHGATFDIRDGRCVNQNHPAVNWYNVRVTDGTIEVEA